MSSSYSRDPRVPPAHVEHLGKHHKTPTRGPIGLPAEPSQAQPVDDGPTYDDFLEHDVERVSDETAG